MEALQIDYFATPEPDSVEPLAVEAYSVAHVDRDRSFRDEVVLPTAGILGLLIVSYGVVKLRERRK